MKAKYYIPILAMIILGSCRSVQKMVDSGDYDSAIELATKRMRGDKVKKTKHIVALEDAFLNINQNDLEEISFLNERDDIYAHERILDIIGNIDYRQKLIAPYLPLVSKDGYRGTFNFINTNRLYTVSSNRLKVLSYAHGEELLGLAETEDDPRLAREAYYAFTRVADFDESFEDTRQRLILTERLGTEHVLVETKFDNDLFLPRDIARYLNDIRYLPGGSRWIRYYDDRELRNDYHYVARLKIDDIQLSPERENRRSFVETKEIEDGEQYVLDDNGNVAKDTLGNDITAPRYVQVEARIKEITREKSLVLRAHMEIINTRSGERITEPIEANARFFDEACIVRGDRRALSSEVRKRVKDFPVEFPTDVDLLFQTGEEVKNGFRYELERMIKRMSV